MNGLSRIAKILATCGLALTMTGVIGFTAGCGGSGGGGSGGGSASSGGGSSSGCQTDNDCGDPQLFFCNTMTFKCEPGCHVQADCTAAKRGEANKLPQCEGSLGCQCDQGTCVAGLCSADTECGSQVCRSGKCVDAPAASTVSKCAISPDAQLMKEGTKARFYVSAWDAANKPVVVKAADIAWSAATAAVTVPASTTGFSAEFTAAAANTAPEAAVKATIGSVNCTGLVQVISKTVAANTVKVLVTDELSGRPIQNADVLVSNPNGSALGSPVKTAADGTASVSTTGATGAISVSVFHNDYNYLTVANYTGTGADANFLEMALRRNQIDKYGGQKGTVKNAPATANVHIGLAGMSVAGSITDLSFSQLLGPSRPTDIKIGNINQKAVPLPDGVYLALSDTMIKTNIAAQGLAGTCTTSAGAPDEAKIATGDCGTRSAWALLGDVSLASLPLDQFTGGTANINYSVILSRLIPLFRNFNSSVIRDVSFTMKATPMSNGVPNFSDTSHFTTADHDYASVGLGFNFVARLPDVPNFRGTPIDGVLILGGASAPGRGVVPLGVGAAVNTMAPVNNKTDKQLDLSEEGLVSVRMAPTHSGLEGADYGLVALGVSLKSVTDASAGLATSAIFSRISSGKLSFDPKGAAPLDLSAGGGFPVIPEKAAYNFTDATQNGLAARTFKFTSAVTTTGISFVRTIFTDDDEHRWVVHSDPAKITDGFVMPKPPGAYKDRTFGTGMSSGPRSSLTVQFVRVTEDGKATGAAVNFAKMVELNSVSATRLGDLTTGFSILDYRRPQVAWLTPLMDGTTITAGSMVTVKVTGFKVGATPTDDGYVRLSFTGGNASCTDVDTKSDPSMGKGEITITLPAGCKSTGGAATMTATLIGANNTPISPPAGSSITATIN